LRIGQSHLLIDEEGAVLERYSGPVETSLPLLLDSSQFQTRYQEKLALAWECLKSLTAEQKAGVEALDLSRGGCVSLYLKGRPTQIMLGDNNFSQKLNFYNSDRDKLESHYGILEYVDLRFKGRIYLKPLDTQEVAALANSKMEGK
jgi:hypothetical protein